MECPYLKKITFEKIYQIEDHDFNITEEDTPSNRY